MENELEKMDLIRDYQTNYSWDVKWLLGENLIEEKVILDLLNR
jgi:hypothetical protein